jgi:hypothetical protein
MPIMYNNTALLTFTVSFASAYVYHNLFVIPHMVLNGSVTNEMALNEPKGRHV